MTLDEEIIEHVKRQKYLASDEKCVQDIKIAKFTFTEKRKDY